jgi:hypothetical protein
MGNKNAPKREKKKPAKTQTKVAPARRREEFIPGPPSKTQ